MTEQAFTVSSDKAPVRLQFTASKELQETLGLLIKPERRRLFGEKTLHAVAREIYLNLSTTRRDQFVPKQEAVYTEYIRGVKGLDTRQFSLKPLVLFERDKGRNLLVGTWLIMNDDERRRIVAPPFYDSDSPLLVAPIIRLSYQDILPDIELPDAEWDVESAFGLRRPVIRAAGRAANNLYLYDLSVRRVPVLARPLPQTDEPPEPESQ